jgi:hypothetical protein
VAFVAVVLVRLAVGRLLERQFHDGLFDERIDSVLEHGILAF